LPRLVEKLSRWAWTSNRWGSGLEGLGSLRVPLRPACGVRRPRERHVAATRLTVLAEDGFPARRRKWHARTRRCESRSAPTRSRDVLPKPRSEPSAQIATRAQSLHLCHSCGSENGVSVRVRTTRKQSGWRSYWRRPAARIGLRNSSRASQSK
jgi:hypothetical protein